MTAVHLQHQALDGRQAPVTEFPDELAAGGAPRRVLLQALEAWRGRLSTAGVACRGIAVQASDPVYRVEFSGALAETLAIWPDLAARVLAGEALVLSKSSGSLGSDRLVATGLQLPDGQPGVIGVSLAAPHNDRTVETLLLSLGWLQLALAAARLERSQSGAKLLELLGHIGSQRGAREAAQEWINRTAAWAREHLSEAGISIRLTLFDVRNGLPRWWVGADTAWAEKASPAVQEAQELAAQAIAEMQEVRTPRDWALPVITLGEVSAVLVVHFDSDGAAVLPETATTVMRASLGLAEPLLRRWQEADRSLLRHHLDAVGRAWRKLRDPGHLAWKAGAAVIVVGLLVLLVWPIPDRVNANTVIEGQIRQVVTAPFDGFFGQVMVRPGQQVKQGQVLARLDDRDLKLERAKSRGERDQAAAKLRQAMAERDAAATTLAQAELQQTDAQLALIEAKLSRAELVAPLNGLLVSGDWVQQVGGPVEIGKELFEIAAGTGYRVVLHVPDRDIARVHLGQPGVLRLTGQPQTPYEFRISNVTATASVQDGINGFRVEAQWQGEVPNLSPGMQGIGKIEVGRSNLLTVWTRSSLDWLRLKIWAWWP